MQTEEYGRMFSLEDRYWWFAGRRYLALALLRQSGLVPTANVLDLGCGTGAVLREISTMANATGLDMSSLALSYSRRRGMKRLIRGDATSLPLTDNSFDAIVALDILEHVEQDRAAFAEAFRVLRPGGVLVLSVPAFRSLWGPHDVALMHHRRYRRRQVQDRLEEAGLRVEKLSYSVFFLFPLVVLTRLAEKLRPGPAHASLPSVPDWLNRSLIALQALEARCILRWSLPWGSSVVAVGRKPHEPRS